MPCFKDPPLITVSEALTQCAMHSQWHRGQNAPRLRVFGATPPTVDLPGDRMMAKVREF